MRFERLASLLIVLGCAVAFVPFAPIFPQGDLDGAWQFAVNAAVAQHLVFGRDLVFTFGPFASVYTLSYHPATDGLAMAASALIAAAAAAGLLVLTRGRWCWAAAGFALLLSSFPLRDPLFLMLPVLFLAVAASPARRSSTVAIVLLALALGLLFLIKGTFAAGSLAALGAGGLTLLYRRRWGTAACVAVLAPLAVVAGWAAAEQPWAALPGFFRAQERIVDGYTAAMSLPGPAWQVALFVAGSALVLGLNAPAWWRAGLVGVISGLGTTMLLLLAFKAGFVRQDEHAAIASGALGLASFVLAFAHRGVLPIGGLVAGAVVWGTIGYSVEGLGPRRTLLQVETTVERAGAGLLDRLRGGTARHEAYEAALSALRNARPLPTPAGPADIYSAGQASLLAHGFDWSPRPVLQSYSAYSPDLAALDAAHLEGADAPKTVFFRPDPIDGHLPALEDGPSWRVLLRRYKVVAFSKDGTATLELAPVAEQEAPSPWTASTARLGEAVALSAGPLWATIDVQPTFAGRALSAVFRPPPLRIAMHFVDGKTISFRFVPGMGRAGFLISPVVADAAHFAALTGPGADNFKDYIPNSFTIEGDARFWSERYSVMIAAQSWPSRPDSVRAVFQPPTPADLPSNTDARCWLDLIDGRTVDHAQVLDATRRVRLNGWAFGGTDQGVAPDTVAVWFRGPDGNVRSVPAMLQYRPDVGVYFHQPQLEKIGFQALVDLSGIEGDVTLGVVMSEGPRHWSCSLIGAHVH